MEEKIRKNCMAVNLKYWLFGGFNLFICTLSMGTFVFSEHFSVDDYWIFYGQKQAGLEVIEQSWRVFVGIFWWVFDAIGINVIAQQRFLGVILIFTFAWVITRISYEIAKAMEMQEDMEKLLFINGGALLLFLNAGVSEHLYYANAYTQWILASVGITYGAICLGRKEKAGINWLAGVGILTVVAGSYQTFLAQYAFIVMTIIFVKHNGKINKQSAAACFRAASAAVVALMIDILGAKALVNFMGGGQNSRLSFDWSKVSMHIREIICFQKSIWIDGMGIYLSGSLLVILSLLIGTLCIAMYKKKAELSEIAFLAAVLFSGLCVMYAAQIMQGFIRVTNRGMYAIFGVYTVLLWMICYYFKEVDWKKIRRMGIYGISLFLLYSIIKTNGIAIDVMVTNAVSRCYIEEIERRICQYESQTNTQIRKIGFCSDSSVSYRYYSFIKTSAYGDMCANPFLAGWSNANSFMYYSHRDLELIDVPDQVAEYYAGKEWNEADWDDQLFFDQDAVYVCMY